MIETVDTGDKQVTRRAVVNAPTHEIFALVVNPHRHHELDGSGTVGANITGTERLHTGDKFSTKMRLFGIPYRTTSTAIRVEDDAVVEWQVGAGQKWRWEFEEIGPNQTQVTETWDVREVSVAWAFKLLGLYGRNGEGMAETLRRLQQRFA